MIREQNTTINTESSQELVDIEDYYEKLYAIKDPNLLLTTILKGRSLGTRAALIQFIFTWIRYSMNGKLITYVKDDKDSRIKLENLCDEFHGFVAIQMVTEQDIVDRKSTFSIKQEAKEIAQKKLEFYKEYSKSFKSNFKQRDKGIMLMAFDHTICEYPPYFYDKDLSTLKYKIQTESSFVSTIQSVLKIISSVEGQIKESYTTKGRKNIHRDLGIITKELIENTEWWAKEKFNSKESYNPNVRGLIIQFNTIEWGKEKEHSNDPLNIFIQDIKNLVKQKNSTQPNIREKRLAFFELSIFDSGPGLARRWEETDYDQLSIEKEYEAVLNCFKQNMSTDLSGTSELRGYGLPKVLKIIGETGFVRLRSGRLSLYRDFNQDNLNEKEEIENKKFKFKDWNSKTFNNPQKMPISEGTLLTIIYPFSY